LSPEPSALASVGNPMIPNPGIGGVPIPGFPDYKNSLK